TYVCKASITNGTTAPPSDTTHWRLAQPAFALANMSENIIITPRDIYFRGSRQMYGQASPLNVWPANVGDTFMDQTNGNLWLKTSGTATATGWAQLGGTTPIASGGTGQTTALAARSSTGLDIEARHAVVDADYAATATDRYIGYTSLTATRTVTLPKASNVNAGAHFVVGDESGSASVTVQIAFAAFAGDTIDGGASIAIEWPYGRREFVSDGAGRWLSDAGIQRRYEKDVASGYAGLDAGTLLLLSEVPTISVAKGGTGQVTTLAARSSAGLNIEDTPPVADAAYAAGNTDRTVAYTSLPAPRIVTLPLAANCNPGQAFTVAD